MFKQGSHASWLATCPATDGNFKTHLMQASLAELEEVYKAIPDAGNKSKKKVIASEINKRKKNKTKEKGE